MRRAGPPTAVWHTVAAGQLETIGIAAGIGVTIVRDGKTTRRPPQVRGDWVSLTGPCRYRCYVGTPTEQAAKAHAVTAALAACGVTNRRRFTRALSALGYQVTRRGAGP